MGQNITFNMSSMGTQNEVTLQDIARALNLSKSTVSRALNGSGNVHDETRSRIRRVAGELGYRRNYFASPLRSQKSRVLGSMVTHLNSTIASCVLSGAETTASQMGYSVIVHQSLNKPHLRTNNLENLVKQNVDGILVTSSFFQEAESVNYLLPLKIPVVVVEASSLLPGRPRKKVSDFQNAYELTRDLIEKGCRRIAYVSVDLNSRRHTDLLSGCREALKDEKESDAEIFVLDAQDDHSTGSAICELLVSSSFCPDGIVFCNNVVSALAFATPERALVTDEFSIIWRKGSISMQNQMLMEIGKLATILLIYLGEKKTQAQNSHVTGLRVKKKVSLMKSNYELTEIGKNG